MEYYTNVSHFKTKCMESEWKEKKMNMNAKKVMKYNEQ